MQLYSFSRNEFARSRFWKIEHSLMLKNTYPFKNVSPGLVGAISVPIAGQVHLCSLWRCVMWSGQAMKVDNPAHGEARQKIA